MVELTQANWPLILIALVIGLVVAWWIFAASRKTQVTVEEKPEDGEGTAPRRNQALIDAPPAAGPLSAAASSDAVAAAPLVADAEAGAEPIPESEMVETPMADPAPEPPASEAGVDDLTQIKGLGPKIAVLLGEQGITSFAQIAGWSEADIDRIDATLGRFEGRIRRDSWVEQAQLLQGDDRAAYEARFGRTE